MHVRPRPSREGHQESTENFRNRYLYRASLLFVAAFTIFELGDGITVPRGLAILGGLGILYIGNLRPFRDD